MVSSIPPFRPQGPKESGSSRGIGGQTRTPHSNRPNQFRRAMKDDHRIKQREREQPVDEVDESEEADSVFELARQAKKKQAQKTSIDKEDQIKKDVSTDAEQIQEDPGLNEEQAFFEEQEFSIVDGEQAQEQPIPEETSEWTIPAEGDFSLEDFYAGIDTLVEKEFSPLPLPHELKENQPNQLLNAAKIQQATVLASQQSATAKVKSDKPIEKSVEKTSTKQKVNSSSKSPTKKTDEVKADLAGATPIAPQAASFHSDKLQEAQKAAPSATIQEIATQIVDRIQIMRKDNETLTTITLRHPPILEGATITLATSDHAKREFNITFANLSPDAKLLLDRRLQEDSLTSTLERKGIIVHTLTTTTQPQNLVSAEAGQTARDRQDQQQQQQQQQKRQQPQTPEDEELT